MQTSSTRAGRRAVKPCHRCWRAYVKPQGTAICRHSPEVGAVCGKAARTDLCGGGGEQSPSLPRPTWAVQQIGGYWGYTGRAANVIVRAAIGRLGAPQCGTLQPRDGANVSAGSTEAGPEAPRLESQLRSDPQADAGKVAGGWTNDFLRGDGLRHGNPVLACTPALKDVLWDTMDVSGSR